LNASVPVLEQSVPQIELIGTFIVMWLMSSMKKPVALVIFLVALTASCVVAVPLVRASGDFWVSRTRLPILVKDLAAVAANGEIYAMGYTYNYTNNNYDTTYNYMYDTTYNYVYDPSTDAWVSKTPMPINQSEFAIATYQNKIYVIGGWIQWETPSMATDFVTGANQVYDIANDTWETKASMPLPRAGLQANVVNGKIYLIGGRLQNGVASDVNEAYDPSTDSWTPMAPIPTPVSDYASVVVDNKIYVMGGGRGGKFGNAVNLVQIYDPQTNNWTYGKPLPTPAGNAAAGAIGGVLSPTRIYVVGISNEYFDINSTAITQIYDTQTNSWTTGASIPAPAYIGFSIVVVNDTLYAVGGRPFARGVPGLFPAVNEQYFPLGSEESTPSPPPSPSNSPTPSPSPTPTLSPSPTSMPIFDGSMAYPIIAVVVIIAVVAIVALVLFKRQRHGSIEKPKA
jgi:N-acetylneuraminic acid mutarotase